MIILGIDPGTATTGYAFVNFNKHLPPNILTFGVITTSPKFSDAQRLKETYNDLVALILRYSPQIACIEKLFFTTNQKTALKVSEARGVCLLGLIQHQLKILEFTPLQVKSIICGHGKANKRQIQNSVKQLYKLTTLPTPDDAADALALAFCGQFAPHLYS